jgi:hypothetical protein
MPITPILGNSPEASVKRARAVHENRYPMTWLNETDLLILEAIRTEPEFPIYPRGASAIPSQNPKDRPAFLAPVPLIPVSPKQFSFFL